ncbi:MAG: hypothetical protein AB9921_07915 [Erysipelotrichaceae bacterium]
MVKKSVILVFLFFLFTLPVHASKWTINELVENADMLDGVVVTIEAEAIGEVMERGEFAWVNINDGTNAIGVYVPIAEAKKIAFFGDYQHTGDTIRFSAIFHNACYEHGGEMDLHASSITIVEVGSLRIHPIDSLKVIVFGFLAFLTLGIGVYFYHTVKPKRVHGHQSEEETE